MTAGVYECEVSVLIPVLNEQAALRTAATAMLAQRLDGRAEFLFIDGGSTDDSPAILTELAAADDRVRVLPNPAQRTPQALNIGLAAARGEFVARMDAHTIYPERYLAKGVERLRRDDVAWVSGPQLAVGTNAGSTRVARALSAPFGRGGARYRDALATEHEVDSGFTGMWRRSTLLAYGGWDEEWLNDQDLELAARIRKNGGRIVCIPEMAAEYVPRDTLPRLARQYFRYGTYRVKTSQRHPETLRPSQLLPPVVVVALAGSALAPGRRLRLVARLAAITYAAGLVVSAARAAERLSEIATLPAVWSTMHVSYGAGFVRGCARYGPPLRAIVLSVTGRGAACPSSAGGGSDAR
jgi:succinoglycan biosynthesis protein ExoA